MDWDFNWTIYVLMFYFKSLIWSNMQHLKMNDDDSGEKVADYHHLMVRPAEEKGSRSVKTNVPPPL